jgi:hypothetical protein
MWKNYIFFVEIKVINKKKKTYTSKLYFSIEFKLLFSF